MPMGRSVLRVLLSVVLQDGPKNGMCINKMRGMTRVIPHLFEIQSFTNIIRTDCAITPLLEVNIGVIAETVKKYENN